MKIKAYKKDFDYTYTLGVFETIELLKNRPDLVLRVYIKSNSYKNKGIPIIDEICREKHIELIESDNTIQKLSKKDNCFAIAIIKKYEMTLQEGNHVVLVNPGDMGNMGTIMRTMLGFNYYNLAIIRPGVDVFDPRVLRASMGAMFHLNIEYFDSFEDYLVIAETIKNAEVENNLAIAVCPSSTSNTVIVARAADELLNISGIDVCFVLSESNGSVAISGRSIGDVNVQVVLEEIGGGGHMNMAGAKLHMPMNEAISLLKESIARNMKE